MSTVSRVECTSYQETRIALSFEKYVAKLNSELDDFWQRPATKPVTEETICWYEKVPVGVNTLGSKMKSLSIDASLSTIYTNHCLRAT